MAAKVYIMYYKKYHLTLMFITMLLLYRTDRCAEMINPAMKKTKEK